ncbi:MAG: AraC family transcriptional regulator [Pseudomonadota bacterium]
MTTNYESRLRRVIRYIHDNPTGDLSLDRLADVAALSRFHFHRVYRAMTGETCAETVRRARLYRASHLLTQTDLPLAEIAHLTGYDNFQSFNRAFRGLFSQTPTVFRQAGHTREMTFTLTIGDSDMPRVEVRDIPAARLASLPHSGAYNTIGKAFEQLSATFAARDLLKDVQGLVAIYYDDIGAVAEDELRSAAAFVVGDDLEMPEGIEEIRTGARRCAVLLHEGPYSGLPEAWASVYRTWLPDSGETPAHAPPFEIYLNDPRNTPPQDLRTEICVPLV